MNDHDQDARDDALVMAYVHANPGCDFWDIHRAWCWYIHPTLDTERRCRGVVERLRLSGHIEWRARRNQGAPEENWGEGWHLTQPLAPAAEDPACATPDSPPSPPRGSTP